MNIKVKGLNLIAIDKETGKEYPSGKFRVNCIAGRYYGMVDENSNHVKLLELKQIKYIGD